MRPSNPQGSYKDEQMVGEPESEEPTVKTTPLVFTGFGDGWGHEPRSVGSL